MDFIYRLESDSQPGNLTGVINFCSELGGYPIYANNAYEWQLIQGQFLCHACGTDGTGRTSDAVDPLMPSVDLEIMLTDVNFNAPYVYTGLISPNQKETNAYWVPRNVSVGSLLPPSLSLSARFVRR